MSKIKNLLALAAIAIFNANEHLNEIFVTSDGQGFTNGEKAKDNARYLKNKDIKHFERGFEGTFVDDVDDTVKPGSKDDLKERETLFAEYEELFGKKPNHMIGNEKLAKQIADKKAEVTAKTNADKKPV